MVTWDTRGAPCGSPMLSEMLCKLVHDRYNFSNNEASNSQLYN